MDRAREAGRLGRGLSAGSVRETLRSRLGGFEEDGGVLLRAASRRACCASRVSNLSVGAASKMVLGKSKLGGRKDGG